MSVALCLTLLLAGGRSAAAQRSYYVDLGGEYSPVRIGTTDVTWHVGRLSAGWLDEGRAGWTAGTERQQRGDRSDWTLSASGFRRLGDWTVSGGAGAGLAPAFSYRQSYSGEIGRRLIGTFVAQGGYRYLNFASTGVHVVQPGATLYLPRGEVGARLFVVHNVSRGTNTSTLLAQATATVHPRVRLGGGVARGERIFDVAALSTPAASSWVGFGYAHLVVTPAWSLDVGFGRAHEDPLFSQTTFTLGVRRTFGMRP